MSFPSPARAANRRLHRAPRCSLPRPAERETGVTARTRRRLRVRGRVQGVFFRDSVRGEATTRGVTGWVANRPDGSVEAVLEGEPEAVEALIAFCRRGPRGAEVDDVEIAEEPVEGSNGFDVR
jgi:acylphosphatase